MGPVEGNILLAVFFVAKLMGPAAPRVTAVCHAIGTAKTLTLSLLHIALAKTRHFVISFTLALGPVSPLRPVPNHLLTLFIIYLIKASIDEYYY